MAVKAIAQIMSFDCETTGWMNLYLHINNFGHVASGVHFGPVDPATTNTAIDSDLQTFVKQYCIDTWSETFGMLDTVRILFKVDSII